MKILFFIPFFLCVLSLSTCKPYEPSKEKTGYLDVKKSNNVVKSDTTILLIKQPSYHKN